MDASEPLRDMLEDMAQAWAGKPVEVVFPGQEVPMEDEDGNVVRRPAPASMATTADGRVILNPDVNGHYDVDLDGPNQLRLLVDALHHEVEHVRQTDLERIGDVKDEYGPNAANLFNLVEDQYINRTRINRHRGRSRDLAFKAESAIMANSEPVDGQPRRRRLTSALTQLCWGGYVKGFSDLPEDDKRFLAWARREIEAARNADDQDERVDRAVEIAKRLEDETDRQEWDLPDSLMDQIVQAMVEGEGVPDDAGGQGMEIEMDMDVEGEPGDGAPTDADVEAGEPDDSGAEQGSGGGQAPEPQDADDEEGEGAGAGGDEEGDEGEQEGAEGDEGEDEGQGTGAGDGGGEGRDGSGSPQDDLEDEIDALEDMDNTDRVKNPFNANPQIESVPEGMIQRWERIQREQEREETDLAYHERKREVIVNNYDRMETSHALDEWGEYLDRHATSDASEPDGRGIRDHSADDIEAAFDRELSEAIEDAFRQFKTRPRERPSKQGPRLNRPGVVRHLAGERGQPLYQRRTERQEMGDRVVGVAVDSSGSMSGDKEKQAKLALAAIAEACDIIGDKFVATTFQINYSWTHDLSLITGPDEPFEYEHLNTMVPGDAECPAPGALFTADLMDRVGARERVLVVIHDGKPHMGLTEGHPDNRSDIETRDRSEEAIEDMRKTVNTLRDEGYKVIGLGVGNSINRTNLSSMFGDGGWVKVGTDGLTDALVNIYRDQMNVDLGGAH